MEKYGQVVLKESNTRFDFVWLTSKNGQFERLDVIDNLSNYSNVSTVNCEAAYYRRQIERFYGDIELIKRIFRTKSAVVTSNIPVKQELEVKDRHVVIKQLREDSRLNLKSCVVMVNGKFEAEYYETSDTIINIESVNSDKQMEVKPINLSEYVSYSVSEDKYVQESASTGDYYSLNYLKAKYPLEHMDEYDFVVVDSMETAIARLKRWAEADTKVKAIDLETTGLEWSMLGKDVTTGIVLSYNEKESTYYPFRQENFDYNLPISFIQTMLDTINSQPKDVMIIGHNAKVELQGIWKEDIHYVRNSEYAREFDKDWEAHALHEPQLRIDGDSFILSILVNPVFIKGLHSLKSLAYRIRKKFFLELEDIFKDKKNIKFNVLPKEIVRYYACPDTANTIAVWNHLIKQLPKDELGILDLEAKVIEVTACNEFYGMRVKRDVLIKSIENESYKVRMLGDMFRGIHKTSKNINSNQVRADIFYNKLRAPVEVRTKTGGPSTSNTALTRIVETGVLKDYDESKIPNPIRDINNAVIISGKELVSNRYPSLVILEKYSKAMKELGALNRIDRKSLKDRVMFNINQAGAASGRQTSDAHQYSDGMKKLIVSDSEDYWLWSCDYKQVELRILAFLAGQQNLIELEKDKDVDIHRAILSIIMGKPIWAISANERKKGKSTNFGVVYMMSAFGLAKKNAGPAYTEDDLVSALKSINDFYNGLPDIKRFVKGNEVYVRKWGHMRTSMGRYRYFKEILDPEVSNKKKASMVRAANNTPVQGFGADLLKVAICNCKDYIKEKGWDKKVESDGLWLPKVRLMLSIHDELLVSSHKSIPIEEIVTMFKVCMEITIKGAPPFFAAPAMVTSWYDGKLDAYEMDLNYRDRVVEAWVNGHQRIIHADTYCDEYDYIKVREINELCRKLRLVVMDSDDTEVTDEIVSKAVDKVNPADKEMLIKHFISPEECYSDDIALHVAVRRALDAKYSHYLEDLNRFRFKRLKDYMEGLIRQYKTPEEVAKHVQHPELTHTLISAKIRKEEKFSHEEAIAESVKRYMEGIDDDDMQNLLNEDIIESTQTYEDLEKYIQFNEDGELIIEDEVTEDEEDDSDATSVMEESTLVAFKPKREYAVYTMSDAIVDLSDFKLGDERAESVNQTIAKLSGAGKPYRVCYFINNKLIPSGLYIDYIPEELNEIIRVCA